MRFLRALLLCLLVASPALTQEKRAGRTRYAFSANGQSVSVWGMVGS
jgi:hypothetical protein